jgi:hypothetical protein
MKLFRKRDKNSRQSAVWLVGIQSVVERKQQKAAGYLNRRTQYWNRNSWLLALGLFILLFGGCCLLLCIKAFIHF